MKTIRVTGKTDADGSLALRIPLGKPDVEYEAVVVLQARETSASGEKPESRGWPPGYFDLAGSIDDATFLRHPQGELPRPVELD